MDGQQQHWTVLQKHDSTSHKKVTNWRTLLEKERRSQGAPAPSQSDGSPTVEEGMVILGFD